MPEKKHKWHTETDTIEWFFEPCGGTAHIAATCEYCGKKAERLQISSYMNDKRADEFERNYSKEAFIAVPLCIGEASTKLSSAYALAARLCRAVAISLSVNVKLNCYNSGKYKEYDW